MPLPKPILVGVLNITPDSFSDGGNFLAPSAAADRIEQLFDEGADVVELGGESTRPQASPVETAVELDRVLPVLRRAMQRRPGAPIAIDTVKARVAALAIAEGASVVNDVSALRLDPAMAETCASAGCRVILMHSRGDVGTMAGAGHATYEDDVMSTIIRELGASVALAVAAGISRDALILDPGIGFSKTSGQSLQALAHLPRLADLGFPVLIGASRKRFLGEITNVPDARHRDDGSIGAHVTALTRGATWFRVHNVRAHRHALDVAHAIVRAGQPERDG